MPTGVDPQIGESASRNSRFADSFSRGRILAETVGVSTAMTVVDVGAFTGETAAWFAGLFPQATIWAIEPFEDSFTQLAAGAGPRTRCWNFAAADYDGSATLFVNAIAHTNSLYAINPDSQDSVDISRRRAEGGGIGSRLHRHFGHGAREASRHVCGGGRDPHDRPPQDRRSRRRSRGTARFAGTPASHAGNPHRGIPL